LHLTKDHVIKSKEEIQASAVLVDGLGVGDVGNIVLRDRKLLSESGLIIVVAAIEKSTGMICSGPDIISRGFVYVRENEDLMNSAKLAVSARLDKCYADGLRDWAGLKNAVKDELKNFIYEKTKRSPVILPIFLEV
jgi:ribonuclease J